MEVGDAKVAQRRQKTEHAKENTGFQRTLVVPGVESQGFQVRPLHMVVKELEHLQGSQAPRASGVTRRQLRRLRGLSQQPSVLLELLASGQGVGQPIEFVVVGNGQAQQTFQIGADHDNGSHEIPILLPMASLLTSREEQVHLWDTEFQDEVGQQLSLAQGPPQQLQTTAPFEAVLFQLGWGVITQDMNTIVAAGCILAFDHFLYILFNCIRGRGRHSQFRADSLFPDAAG